VESQLFEAGEVVVVVGQYRKDQIAEEQPVIRSPCFLKTEE